MARQETPAEFRARMLSIGFMPHGRGKSTRVHEYHDEADGHFIKETTDELNNTVTEHGGKEDRVDVLIRPDTIHLKAKAEL